jgi:hypothetical protein
VDLVTTRVGTISGMCPFKAHPSTKTAKNSDETAGMSLFFNSPNRRRPRISAGKEVPVADNLLQKQQKQREVPCLVWHCPPTLCTS